MGFSIDFSKLRKRLSDMDKRASEAIIDKALEAGAEVLIDSLKKNINDLATDTGELRDSIGVTKKYGSGLERKLRIAPKTSKKEVHDRAFYTNYGTRHIAGRNWKQKSIDESRDEINKRIKEVVEEEIFKV